MIEFMFEHLHNFYGVDAIERSVAFRFVTVAIENDDDRLASCSLFVALEATRDESALVMLFYKVLTGSLPHDLCPGMVFLLEICGRVGQVKWINVPSGMLSMSGASWRHLRLQWTQLKTLPLRPV